MHWITTCQQSFCDGHLQLRQFITVDEPQADYDELIVTNAKSRPEVCDLLVNWRSFDVREHGNHMYSGAVSKLILDPTMMDYNLAAPVDYCMRHRKAAGISSGGLGAELRLALIRCRG